MTSKDKKSSGSKGELMKDLKSLKTTLDEDDDNVPLLLGDEDDIPLLADTDDDIPVLNNSSDKDIPILDTPELPDQRSAADKASLEAALRQLESMELAPKSRKTTPTPPAPAPAPAPASASASAATTSKSIEEKIRANAAPPIISNEELTRVRDNPFLNPHQKAQLELSRKLREEAKKTALITALNKKKEAAPMSPSPSTSEGAIEFTDNPFLKASTAPVSTHGTHTAIPASNAKDEEVSAAAIPKKSGEGTLDLGDIVLEDETSMATPAAAQVKKNDSASMKLHDMEIDLIINEIIEEYQIILEAALRKKLKEKLPDLLK